MHSEPPNDGKTKSSHGPPSSHSHSPYPPRTFLSSHPHLLGLHGVDSRRLLAALIDDEVGEVVVQDGHHADPHLGATMVSHSGGAVA